MQFIKNKFLLITVIFPLLWFGLDKIFAMQIVRDYTIPWKKIEILFYESKQDLFSVYEENLPKHKKENMKRAVVLGTSRSGEFSPHDISKEIPGIATYNFSAPLAGPAFHYYWLEKLIEKDKDLSLIILEIDPILFSKTSLTYSLNYSLDLDYVLGNSHFFPERFANPWKESNTAGFNWDEVETWLTKKIFYSYRFPPEPSSIKANKKETFAVVEGNVVSVTGKDYKKMFHDTIILANRKELGAIPNQIMHHGDEKFLEKDAMNMVNIHFGENFKPSPTQIAFFRKILKISAENNIDLILYWPLVAEPLRKEMERRNMIVDYKNHIQNDIKLIEERYPEWKVELLDPQHDERLKCRAFVDSVHLSGACYPELFSLFGSSFPR
jgi:hypothetical protein